MSWKGEAKDMAKNNDLQLKTAADLINKLLVEQEYLENVLETLCETYKEANMGVQESILYMLFKYVQGMRINYMEKLADILD